MERITYGAAPENFGILRAPAGQGLHPVVVVIHGGMWRAMYDLEYIEPVCAALTQAGIATWNIEYRRVGNGGGFPMTFQDVAAAVDSVRALAPKYSLDLARVITFGHSAGGHLALWAAARQRIPADNPLATEKPLALRAAVSLAGVVDLRLCWKLNLGGKIVEDLVGGTPDEFPERYAVTSPVEMLPLGIPQILMHGTADDTIPFEMSERYCDAAVAQHDHAMLLPLDGAGHFEPVDPATREFAVVRDTLLTLLR